MDDIQRAISTLKNEKGRIVFGIANEVLMNEREMKFVEAIDIAVSAMQELQQYREAMVKYRSKEPKIQEEEYSYGFLCPHCNARLISKDETGWFAGQKYRYCLYCGQAINWSDEK